MGKDRQDSQNHGKDEIEGDDDGGDDDGGDDDGGDDDGDDCDGGDGTYDCWPKEDVNY